MNNKVDKYKTTLGLKYFHSTKMGLCQLWLKHDATIQAYLLMQYLNSGLPFIMSGCFMESRTMKISPLKINQYNCTVSGSYHGVLSLLCECVWSQCSYCVLTRDHTLIHNSLERRSTLSGASMLAAVSNRWAFKDPALVIICVYTTHTQYTYLLQT